MPTPTVLAQVQAALRELGLPVPEAAANAEDSTAQQCFGLWTALGQELYAQYRWKELQRTHVFFTELNRSLYPLPADWTGPTDQTEFDRTDHWALLGEMSPQQWAVLKGGIVALGPRMRYRYIDDSIELFPIPTSINGTFTPIELSFEYYAGGWVIKPDGTVANEATSDADRAVYPNRLMVNGVKLKLFQIKGFDVTTLQTDFDGSFNQAMSRNHGAPRLSLSPRVMPYLIGVGNLPDGSWNVNP